MVKMRDHDDLDLNGQLPAGLRRRLVPGFRMYTKICTYNSCGWPCRTCIYEELASVYVGFKSHKNVFSICIWSTCKWTCTVETHVVQQSTVLNIRTHICQVSVTVVKSQKDQTSHFCVKNKHFTLGAVLYKPVFLRQILRQVAHSEQHSQTASL